MSSCICGRCSGRYTCDSWKKNSASKDDHSQDKDKHNDKGKGKSNDKDSSSDTGNGLVTGPLRLFGGTLIYPAVQSLSDCKLDVLIKFIRKDVPTAPTDINPCVCCPVTIDCRCVTIPGQCCAEDLESPQTAGEPFFTVPEDGVYEVGFCPLNPCATIRATLTIVVSNPDGLNPTTVQGSVEVFPNAWMLPE